MSTRAKTQLLLSALGCLFALLLWELFDNSRIPVRRLGLTTGEAGIDLALVERARIPSNERNTARVYTRLFDAVEAVEWTDHRGECGMRMGKRNERRHGHADVAILGESIAYGLEVDHEESLAGELQKRLDVNILNLAMPGSNSRIYPQIAGFFLKCLGRRPSAAIVGLFPDLYVGDISRWLATETFGEPAMLDGVRVSATTYRQAMASRWFRLKFNLNVEARRWSSLYNRLLRATPRLDFAIPIADQLTPENVDIWEERITRHVDGLRQALDLPPSHLIVWFEPSAHELNDTITASRQARTPLPHFAAGRVLWRRIAAQLSSRGYPVVDAQDATQNIYFNSGIYPYSASGHLRPAAYQKAANMIAPVLQNIIPMR